MNKTQTVLGFVLLILIVGAAIGCGSIPAQGESFLKQPPSGGMDQW